MGSKLGCDSLTGDMARLLIEQPTGAACLDDVRGDIDSTLERHLPGNLLACQWEGDVLRITGPGADGTLEFDSGLLRLQASLRPPASMLRQAIEHKIRAAFAEAFPIDGSCRP